MTSAVHKQSDGTIEFTISIPWKTIQQEYKQAVEVLIKDVEIKGFRKGKAPRERAEKELDKNKVYEEVIKTVVPKTYTEALKKHNITPIVQPEITLVKAKEGEDWQIKAATCEKPNIDLGDYKRTVKKAKGELKKDDLWLPGKEQKEKEDEGTKRQKTLNKILEELLKSASIILPSILIKAEVDRRLTKLLDDLKKLGMTIDSYAKSKNVSPDQVREQTQKEVENTFKLEFIFEELASKESIRVEDNEIDKVIENTKDQSEKESLKSNKYYLASMLKRQKTLDKLLSL